MNKTDEFKDIEQKLPKLYNNLKEKAFLSGIRFDKVFVDEVQSIKNYLIQMRLKCDQYDKSLPSKAAIIDYINREKTNSFNILNDYFQSIWSFASKLSKQEYRLYQLYIQKELYKYVGLTPFNKHIYEQPLGYPGDYIMMNYLYEDDYIGDSTFDILIHRYTCSIPMARANINRRHYFTRHINEYIKTCKGHARIASIACGPAREAVDIISKNNNITECTFSFFDFEPRALDFIKSEINKLRLKKEPKIIFINENMFTIVKPKIAEEKIGKQDLIYVAGLIDYMSDKMSSRIVETLFSLLNNKGRLIVGNVTKGIELLAYTEMLGEWYINYRDKEDLLKLTKGVKGANKISIDYEPETKRNIFLIIDK